LRTGFSGAWILFITQVICLLSVASLLKALFENEIEAAAFFTANERALFRFWG
jgi:hypothetical protein